MAAKDARKWGMCGHTFHPHIVYLRALLVRNRRLFFRICFVASCEMAVAGRTGPNAVGIMPKVHDMWVNSLAALLGALAAIRSLLCLFMYKIWYLWYNGAIQVLYALC